MTPSTPIYLDHCASTPTDPRAFEAMRPYFCEIFGNAASSGHSFGFDAAAAVAEARRNVAALFNANAGEIVFTSGATEANNLAVKGVADALSERGRHVVTQTTEHKAVLDACKRLAKKGWAISWVGVDEDGRVDPADVARAIRPDTTLVSIMWANNETGVLQPIGEIGRICRERGVTFHTDATQAVGKVPIDVQAEAVDLLSFTGHKIYGPKGCGGLYIRRQDPPLAITPQLDGGGHERGLRSGTLNVPGIVGVGVALDLARQEMEAEISKLAALRDLLEQSLLSRLPDVRVNGDIRHRLPNVSNLSFGGIGEGDSIIDNLDDVAVSGGSACQSSNPDASYVLRAMGVPTPYAFNAVRFSVGRWTTREQIERAVERVAAVVKMLRDRRSASGR